MFIPDLLLLELSLILLLVDLLESILESTIICLEDGVFGGQVKRILSSKGKFKAAMSELLDTLISIIHGKANSTLSFILVDFHSLLSAVVSLEDNFKGSRLINYEICGLILISECVPADNDGLFPSRDESWDVLDNDWFSEDSSIEDVSDGSIGTFPHFFQVELLDSGLIGSDGCAFDSNLTLLDGFSSLDGDLIFSGISVLNSEVEVEDVEVEEGENKFVLDGLPNDSGHLISVKLSYWLSHFDFWDLHKILC
jgi:hypothetical protein